METWGRTGNFPTIESIDLSSNKYCITVLVALSEKFAQRVRNFANEGEAEASKRTSYKISARSHLYCELFPCTKRGKFRKKTEK